MRRRRLTTIYALVLLGAIGAVFIYASGVRYSDIQRHVRIALGLPKLWKNDFNDSTARYMPLPCPRDALVIVSGGQSNGANSYDLAPPADGNQNTFMFFSGQCFKLQSPVLGASGNRDSLWPVLGDKINRTTARPVVLINGAVGGSQLGDWLDDRSHYFSRLAGQLSLAAKQGLRPSLVLWIQGETDAAVDLEPESYAREQKALIDKFDAAGLTDGKTHWVVYLSTRCLHRDTNGADIERALRDLATRANGRIVIGPNVTGYDDSYRHDTCHLNTRGRDRLVDETLAVLSRDGLLRPVDPSAPGP